MATTNTPIVDIHCHTFNADDLPVKGFVTKVAGAKKSLAKVLAGVADRVTQSMAEDARDENRELDELLSQPDGGLEAVGPDPLAEAAQDVEVIMAGLDQAGREELAAAGREISAERPVDTEGEEGLFDALGDVTRYMMWALLFGKRRLALTTALTRTFPEVALFTPLSVDFQGLEDEPTTPIVLQLEIQEKISRLSMRGDLSAAVHPFVGFDPRRADAMRNAELGVERFGCVGVKLYPPMGFRPIDNVKTAPRGMSPSQAEKVDETLTELYAWCQSEHVPITAHCNPSNYAHKDFEEFSHPDLWNEVLSRNPDLHLNLGHFGWGGRERGWTDAISRMAGHFDHLYADIGNHHVEDLDDTVERLSRLFDPAQTETRAMADRLMFGTDWFMLAAHRGFKEFLTRFREVYTENFDANIDGFMGGHALRFLGFDDPQNRNNRRLLQRYESNGFDPPPWLVN